LQAGRIATVSPTASRRPADDRGSRKLQKFSKIFPHFARPSKSEGKHGRIGLSQERWEPVMSSREEIAQQALSLSPEDRAYVADVIEQSFRGVDFATPEIAAAWMAEIEKRAQAYERGETLAEDWRTVISRLRTRESADSKRCGSN
jgi:hypothetical protein